MWVTVKEVPVVVVSAGVERANEVPSVMDVMVTVSGRVWTAVKVTEADVAVAAIVKVKLVALLIDAATWSLAGMPGPEITVPWENVTGVVVVTVVLPAAVFARKVVVVVVVLGIPVPLIVIPWVKAAVEVVVTTRLPLVVLAEMVVDNPVLEIQGLLLLWQVTQKVGLVDASYWVFPRFGVAATPLMVTFDVRPSWL